MYISGDYNRFLYSQIHDSENSKPDITPEVLEESQNSKLLQRLVKDNNCSTKEYKKYQKYYNHLLKAARIKHSNILVANATNENNGVWNIVINT